MYRKTWLEVDLDAVMHNVRTLPIDWRAVIKRIQGLP